MQTCGPGVRTLTTRISISVVFALPERQWIVDLECESGVTLEQAVERSGLRDLLQGYSDLEYGVYGFRQPLDHILSDGDRVEVYRSLTLSPTEARRLRAKANQSVTG